MVRLDQSEIDDLNSCVGDLAPRSTSERHDYFNVLMTEKPMFVDHRAPHCIIEYLSIIGRGSTIEEAMDEWIDRAIEWQKEFEFVRAQAS